MATSQQNQKYYWIENANLVVQLFVKYYLNNIDENKIEYDIATFKYKINKEANQNFDDQASSRGIKLDD